MHSLSVPENPVELTNWGKNFREKLKFCRKFSYCFSGCLILLDVILTLLKEINPEAKIPLLLFSLAILLFGFLYGYYHDNFIYEEISPGTYRAILMGNGIGKLNDFQKISLLKQVFENEIRIPVQVPKKHNARLYATIISLILVCCLMFWGPITSKMFCTHIKGHTYQCELHPKTVLRNLDVVNLGAVTGAFVKYDHIEFRSVYDHRNITYKTVKLINFPSLLDKKVNAINRRFNQEKDFTYHLVNYFVILLYIILFILPFAIGVMEWKWKREVTDNNYFSPERYKAILRAEGLDSFHSMQFGNVVMEVTDKKDVNYLKDDKFIGVQKEILKQDLQRYKEPVTFANLSENTSNERAKYIKIVSYFVALMIIIIFFSSAYTKIFGRTFSCTYKGNESYDCVVKVSDGKDFERYEGIVSAVMDYSEDGDRVGYKDINGKVFYEPQFNFSFMNNTKKMEKDVKALNAKFSKNENFVYNFKNNRHLPFGFILFICIPFIIFFMLYYYLSNYINKKVSLAQYNAVLKENGIGKLDRVKQQAPMQVYDNSWSGKYQAQMDKDVEDLTKQFYDDGK